MKLHAWLLIGCFLDLFAGYYGYTYTLSEFLWENTSKQQAAALKTAFIQGLTNKNLDPTSFGVFMVQDAVYCYRSKLAIDIAFQKAKDPFLKEFLANRSKSYDGYARDLLKTWHIGDPDGIVLGPACDNYVNHLYDVANNMPPIYLVVALTPCAKLWPWLGQQLYATQRDFGVYTEWTKENLDPDSHGYVKYDAMVDMAYSKKEIDETLALEVYSKSMDGEVAFFSLDGA